MRRIRQVAVIGSGIMGGGIAALFAGAGVKTVLLDIVPPDLEDAEKNDPQAKNRVVQSGLEAALSAKPPLFMTPKDADRIRIGNLEDDFETLSECDWIIEAVVENLKVKRELFQRIETVRRPDAIVSTNTSGIPLKAISEGLTGDFKAHFLGTHFFNPVRYMKLLEIIPGDATLPEVLNFVADFGERVLGKGIVWAKDTPNFVGNRIGVQGLLKAVNLMVAEGLQIHEVDALFGPALGRPKTALFRLCDLVGIDTLGHIAKNTYEMVQDDEDRESYVLPEFVQEMIRKKLLGNKTKSGFYKTEKAADGKKIIKVLDPGSFEYTEFESPAFPCLAEAKKAATLADKMKAVLFGEDAGARFAWKVIANGWIYAANRIPEIADSVVEIDNAMKWGFNFEMGPFEQWDAVGLKETVERMHREGFAVPEKIDKMVESGAVSFYRLTDGVLEHYDFSTQRYQPVQVSPNILSLKNLKAAEKTVKTGPSATLVDLGDGVFCCEFHTKMNAINDEIIEMLHFSLDHVDQEGAGLVVGNQAGGVPGAFSAGADLFLMAQLAMQGRFPVIGEYVKKFQDVLQRIKYAPFPVVAAPFGLTLGGGCELCLSADRIVAHADLYMGLVEIGVGLLPAGGGCLNLWRKLTAAIPESVTDVELGRFFVSAFTTIATAKVSASAADARSIGFLGPSDRIVFNKDYLIGEAKKEAAEMAFEGYAPPVKRPVTVMGMAGQGMANAEVFNMAEGGFISEYDAFLARHIARVISGGDVRDKGAVTEDVILALEREAFMTFWKEPKTHARVEHMLKTGKPLRN